MATSLENNSWIFSRNSDNEINFKFYLIENLLQLLLIDETSKTVLLKIPAVKASLRSITEALKNKYPELGSDFVLCHRDGTLLPSNAITESSRFWYNRNLDVCVVKNYSKCGDINNIFKDHVQKGESGMYFKIFPSLDNFEKMLFVYFLLFEKCYSSYFSLLFFI